MHTTSGRDSIRCLTRTPRGCLWHSPIMHYRLEGCRPHFLVLHRCRLPVNLRWDLGRVNKRWSRPSMEWRLSTDGDDHLGSGHDVDGCCLCIVRYRGNSSCWLGLWIATVSLKKTYALLNKREVKIQLWIETKSRSIKRQRRTRSIPSHHLVNKGFIKWPKKRTFSCASSTGNDGPIYPAWEANQNTRFAPFNLNPAQEFTTKDFTKSVNTKSYYQWSWN